jgi:hypothetical protein
MQFFGLNIYADNPTKSLGTLYFILWCIHISSWARYWVKGIQHKCVCLYFTPEAKNSACKISAKKTFLVQLVLVKLVLVELSFGGVVFWSSCLLVELVLVDLTWSSCHLVMLSNIHHHSVKHKLHDINIEQQLRTSQLLGNHRALLKCRGRVSWRKLLPLWGG